MKVLIVTPASPGTRHGNRVTALRWRRILGALGHRVAIVQTYTGQAADVLVALHARHSHGAVMAFRRRYSRRPVLVALTGTDIYRDLPRNRAARESLAAAFRLIVLQPLAVRRVPPRHRARVRVIVQSFAPTARIAAAAAGNPVLVAVVGHLRDVKDPLRAAMSVRRLPHESTLRVFHAGAAMAPHWAARARREMTRNPRYRWLGHLSAAATARLMKRSAVLVLSSRSEGGANVVSEAIGLGLPILASRIPGNVGLLGARYPGYFPAGDARALRRLLLRFERDASFRARLRLAIRRLRPRFTSQKERAAWRMLLGECLTFRQKQEGTRPIALVLGHRRRNSS